MFINIRPQPDFFNNNLRGFCFNLFLLLFLFVEEFFVIDYFTNWWISIRADLYKIKILFISQCQCLLDIKNSTFDIFSDNSDDRCFDPFIDLVQVFYSPGLPSVEPVFVKWTSYCKFSYIN